MASKEKLRQLNELFSYDEIDSSPFSINKLLDSPSIFLNFCYDFTDEEAVKHYFDIMTKTSPKFDERALQSFYGSKKEDLKKFCLDYIDRIDLNRLTLFAYHRLEQTKTKGSQIKQKKHALDSLKHLLGKYSDLNTIIYFFRGSNETRSHLPEIFSISSDNVLGISRPKQDFLTDEQYKRYMKYFTLDSVKNVLGDARIYSALRMFYTDLIEQHKDMSDQQKVKLLMSNSCYRDAIDPAQYILTLNYSIVDRLKSSSSGMSLMEFIEIVKDFQDINSYIDLEDYLNSDFRDQFAGRNFLLEFGEVTSKHSSLFLEQDGSNIDTLIPFGLIDRNTFQKYFHASIDKESTLSYASSYGLISNEEFDRYSRQYSLDEQKIILNTFNRCLDAIGIKKADYLNWPLNDKGFRNIIPATELNSLVSALIKNATKNSESTISTSKLYMLLEDGIINESFLKRLYLNSDISIEDVDTLKRFYDDYNVGNLYGFEQSTKQLVTLYKYVYADDISKAMQEEGDSFDEKPLFVDPDEHELEENYEFQRKLFMESSKSQYTKTSELEEELDYLILYRGVAKHLYHQGLIDIRTLKEHIDDSGEVPEKRETTLMVLNGEVANEDLPFLVKNTSLEDNAFVLTRLYESGNLTYREIIEKYLAGNISYGSLVDFGDGRDLSSAFNENRYLGLFSNAINSANVDKSKLFARYKRAFHFFMPNVDTTKLYAKQKSELSKCKKPDKLACYYRENVIDGKNILDLLDDSNIKFRKRILDSLADLILTQDLSVHDCELLFKDSDNSTNKRKRLEFILSTYDIPDEIKMKTILDTYFENTEQDLINYDYLLKNCFEKASEDRTAAEPEFTTTREKGTRTEKPEQEVMPYPLRYRDIISIDPSMTSKILGSKIMFHSSRYNKYLFEQMYTTKNNMNSQLTTHATYILSDELVEQIRNQLFTTDKEGNITDFDYKVLTDTYRHGDKTQVSKTLHKSRSWISQLRKKITGGHRLAQPVLEQIADMELG